MFEGMKYFSFLFCLWGKNPGVRIQRLNFAGDNNHDRNMPDEMIKMGPFTETFLRSSPELTYLKDSWQV